MRSDASLAFVPIGGNLSLVGGAGVAIPSTNVIDLLGQGVGTAPANIIGNAGTFGEDPGIGRVKPELAVVVGTAATTGNSATLNVQLQYAADTGAGGGYAPGTWQTVAETGPIAASALTAGTKVARFPFLPAFPEGVRPRYIRMNFAPAAATNFTAGTIAYALVVAARDDAANKYVANNFAAP